jgi:hypothetical protein
MNAEQLFTLYTLKLKLTIVPNLEKPLQVLAASRQN